MVSIFQRLLNSTPHRKNSGMEKEKERRQISVFLPRSGKMTLLHQAKERGGGERARKILKPPPPISPFAPQESSRRTQFLQSSFSQIQIFLQTLAFPIHVSCSFCLQLRCSSFALAIQLRLDGGGRGNKSQFCSPFLSQPHSNGGDSGDLQLHTSATIEIKYFSKKYFNNCQLLLERIMFLNYF